MPQEWIFPSSYFFDLNNVVAEGEQTSWFLWVLQSCKAAFYVQYLPARLTVLKALGLCFPLLSPGRDAHNCISQFTLSTFQLAKQFFSTSIFGLNFSFYLPPNFTLNTFAQGSGIRSNELCILVWSWWIHCCPEAFPGLPNSGYVQKNFLLHTPVDSSWILHFLPACQWLSCWKQPVEGQWRFGGQSQCPENQWDAVS